MHREIYRRPYRMRKAALRGKEVSVPPEVAIKPGETVVAFFDNSFILYLPKGSMVNEEMLLKAIKVKR